MKPPIPQMFNWMLDNECLNRRDEFPLFTGCANFVRGARFTYPLAFTEGVRAAVESLRSAKASLVAHNAIEDNHCCTGDVLADWLLSHFGIEERE